MYHYPFHIADFRAATGHLNKLEKLIYRELIDHYMDRERPFTPDEVVGLIRRCDCRTEDERAAFMAVLDEFFPLDPVGNVRRNDRCDREIEHYRHRLTVASEAGKASAAKRAAKAPAKTTKRDKATGVQRPSTNQEPRTTTVHPEDERSLSAASPRPTKRPPADFTVTAEMAAWAMNGDLLDATGQPAHLQLREIKAQTAAFIDHTFSHARTDWVATWRNWIRKYAASTERQRALANRGYLGAPTKDAERRNTIETLTGRKQHGTGRQGLVIDGESRVVGEGEGQPPEPDR